MRQRADCEANRHAKRGGNVEQDTLSLQSAVRLDSRCRVEKGAKGSAKAKNLVGSVVLFLCSA